MDRQNLAIKSSKDGNLYPRRIVYGSFVKSENNNGHVKFNLVVNKGKDKDPEYVNDINVRTDNPKRADLITGLAKGTPMLAILSTQVNKKDDKEYTNLWLDAFSLSTGLKLNVIETGTDGKARDKILVVGNLVRVNENNGYVSFDLVINKGKDKEPEYINRISLNKNASDKFIAMIKDLQNGQTMAAVVSESTVVKDGKTYINHYLDELQLFPRKKDAE